MGIRIHKKLGFGFADLKVDKKVIADPRINSEVLYENEAGTYSEYYSWLKNTVDSRSELITYKSGLEHLEIQERIQKKGKRSLLTDYVDADITFRPDSDFRSNNPGWLIITPFTVKPEWSRFDDPIDYALAQQAYVEGRQEPMEETVETLDWAPFPYEGMYRNIETGDSVDTFKAQEVKRVYETAPETADKLAKQLFGFDTYGLFSKTIQQAVPENLKYLTDWLGVFTSPDIWMQMKPMSVTYWS